MSGVGVVLRDEDREFEPSRPLRALGLLLRSLKELLADKDCEWEWWWCGWWMSLLRPVTPLARFQPRHPVHHSQPPSARATSRCLARILRLSSRLRSFSLPQYSALYISHPSLKSGVNGLGNRMSLIRSPPGAISSSAYSLPSSTILCLAKPSERSFLFS